MTTKPDMLLAGIELMRRWCRANAFEIPDVELKSGPWPFGAGTCAYYRASKIVIYPKLCADIGRHASQWSFPGYCIDRTPYGVMQHELGHHVDLCRGTVKRAYWSDFSSRMRQESGEEKLTNYCPNDAEWFAEMFRLFVTNPDLLKLIRPKTHFVMLAAGLKPVEERPWREVLATAPERTIAQCMKRMPRTAAMQPGFF